MMWFYKDGTQEVGPVDKNRLQELVHAKKINGRTLVRNTTMTQWRPLAELAGAKKAASQPPADTPPEPPPQPSAAPAPPPAEAVLSTETVVCSQCHRSSPETQVVWFDGQAICVACKPLFVQRLKEGVATGAVMQYAGFWVRFGAKIIDYLILGIFQAILIGAMGLLVTTSAPSYDDPEAFFSSGAMWMLGLQQLIAILIPALYTSFFLGRFGATPGKMACKLKVVSAEGTRVSYLRGLGRYFAEFISAMILLIGYLMAAFDNEKRSLHDRICSTRVVRN